MFRPLIAAFAIVLATPAATQAAPTPPASYGAPITVSAALKLIEKGMKLAEAKNLKMAFAVVEPTGELVAFARMDDVSYAPIKIAQQKARASARFRLPTSEFETRVLAGRTVLLSSDEVIAVGGGLPIIENNKVVGALGVSGGSAAEDSAVAAATLGDQ